MKIHPIQSIVAVTVPFKTGSDKRIMLELILQGEVIVSGINKQDLASINISTTVGDAIFTPRTIRIEIDTRYLSQKKVEQIFQRAISETNVMFLKDNIHLAKQIIKSYKQKESIHFTK